jgi:acyl-CoA synthetase (AMP-forming)/AMP-acid ligase II
VYGSTELGVDTVLRPEDHLRKPGSCGQAAPGIEIKLFDEEGAEVTEPFQMGELYVRSATVQRLLQGRGEVRGGHPGDFHTVGDIAYRDEEGYYYIADRKNDMIISGGMNIYPAEIEAALDASPTSTRWRCSGSPTRSGGRACTPWWCPPAGGHRRRRSPPSPVSTWPGTRCLGR